MACDPQITAAQLLELARDAGARIATAESCTGGLVIAELTEVAGSSSVVECGFVTYSNAAKEQMLGVKADTLATYGAVSEQVAIEMATGALERSNADLAVAITGIAGPGPSEHKPEGRVCFAIAQTSRQATGETQDFGAQGRSAVRRVSVAHALNILARALT